MEQIKKVIKWFPLISQLGFQFIFTILISVWIGIKLDKFFGVDERLFTILGIVVGIFAAGIGAYQIIIKFLDEETSDG